MINFSLLIAAQIQTLKKSICKGDKKKKKEIAEEIGRLEEGLEKQQAEEVNTWKLTHITLNNETEFVQEHDEVNKDNNCPKQSVHKVSRAQKRRDKKAIAEIERNQRIIEQEALNVFDKRNIEIEAIKKILTERNLMVYEIPSDGHW